MQQTPTYQQRSREFLAKAYRELDEDPVQASEKGWGAASTIVKAIAEERGWEHHFHRALQNVVNELVRETNDDELSDLFAVANGLHRNFYEDYYSRRRVERGINAVEQFVAKVEGLMVQPG